MGEITGRSWLLSKVHVCINLQSGAEVYVYMYVCVCVCVCVCVQTRVSMYMCACMYACVGRWVWVHGCMSVGEYGYVLHVG